ncbi:hypothetical protein [Verrucomicrobium sp. BvORR106]|nr:hypothetical protein [Verrucomicrobium sp. BvORR106]
MLRRAFVYAAGRVITVGSDPQQFRAAAAFAGDLDQVVFSKK